MAGARIIRDVPPTFPPFPGSALRAPRAENPRRSGLFRRRRARRPAPDRLPGSPDRWSLAPAPGARQRRGTGAPRRAHRGRGGAARRLVSAPGRGRSRTRGPFVASLAAARRTRPARPSRARPPKDWMLDLTHALDLRVDAAVEDVGDAAKTLAAGEGSAVAAAAKVAASACKSAPMPRPRALAGGCRARPSPEMAGTDRPRRRLTKVRGRRQA